MRQCQIMYRETSKCWKCRSQTRMLNRLWVERRVKVQKCNVKREYLRQHIMICRNVKTWKRESWDVLNVKTWNVKTWIVRRVECQNVKCWECENVNRKTCWMSKRETWKRENVNRVECQNVKTWKRKNVKTWDVLNVKTWMINRKNLRPYRIS